MSVSVYSPEELSGLYHTLSADQDGRTSDRLALAIRALSIAQHAAYCMTYGEAVELPATFDALRARPDCHTPRVSGWTACQWVRNATYNAIANNGDDFCPPSVRELLTDCAVALDARALAQRSAARP